jgi:hypothetical protein
MTAQIIQFPVRPQHQPEPESIPVEHEPDERWYDVLKQAVAVLDDVRNEPTVYSGSAVTRRDVVRAPADQRKGYCFQGAKYATVSVERYRGRQMRCKEGGCANCIDWLTLSELRRALAYIFDYAETLHASTYPDYETFRADRRTVKQAGAKLWFRDEQDDVVILIHSDPLPGSTPVVGWRAILEGLLRCAAYAIVGTRKDGDVYTPNAHGPIPRPPKGERDPDVYWCPIASTRRLQDVNLLVQNAIKREDAPERKLGKRWQGTVDEYTYDDLSRLEREVVIDTLKQKIEPEAKSEFASKIARYKKGGERRVAVGSFEESLRNWERWD